MKRSKFFTSLILAGMLILAQVPTVFAATNEKAERPVSGIIQSITLASDPNSGVTTVVVTVMDAQKKGQLVRISTETAAELGVVTLDGDGNPVINELALGQEIEIDSATIIENETQHPVANALATFFSDIEGLDYAVIMEANGRGNGFGVIAQVLWLTRKLEGTATDFLALLNAKKNNDFSDFVLEDGSIPTSWGQLKKAIMDGDKPGNLGLAISNRDNNSNGNSANHGNRGNNGNGNGHGNGNGNGNRP